LLLFTDNAFAERGAAIYYFKVITRIFARKYRKPGLETTARSVKKLELKDDEE